MKKYYEICGLCVEMESFGRTVTQAEPYLCEARDADICITSDWRALKARQPHLSDEDCEYLSTGASFYYQLLKFGGMLLHASAVVVDGEAYLFSAPCGTGKSTHTNLWRKVFGERAVILNDDKPALRLEDGVWYAYGTPWSGKTDQNLNIRARLKGICVLRRGEVNKIERFRGSRAVFALLEQTARPAAAQGRELLLEMLDKLLRGVPVWQMECNISEDAVHTSYGAMSRGE